MTTALEGGEWSVARLGRTLPPGKTRYPLYKRLGRPQGRSGRAKNLAPSGFDLRSVQPVAQSLYRLSYPAHSIYPVSQRNIPEDFNFKQIDRENLSLAKPYSHKLHFSSRSCKVCEEFTALVIHLS